RWLGSGPTRGWTARSGTSRTGTGRSELGLRADRRPVEGVERSADGHVAADEDRGVALGVAGRLALAQRQHKVHEVGRLVALERGHELLVVDPERVRRVVVDPGELLAADPDVLVHRSLAIL